MRKLPHTVELIGHTTTREKPIGTEFIVLTSFIYFGSTAVRMFAHEGSPWFALPDLCSALGLDDIVASAELLADYERTAAMLLPANAQQEVVTAVNLSALLTLLSNSPDRRVAQSLKWLVMTRIVPTLNLLAAPIVLPSQIDEDLMSTTDIADWLGVAPQALG